jgi:hypothetical protein
VKLLGMLGVRRVLCVPTYATQVATLVNNLAALVCVSVLSEVNCSVANRASDFFAHGNLPAGKHRQPMRALYRYVRYRTLFSDQPDRRKGNYSFSACEDGSCWGMKKVLRSAAVISLPKSFLKRSRIC